MLKFLLSLLFFALNLFSYAFVARDIWNWYLSEWAGLDATMLPVIGIYFIVKLTTAALRRGTPDDAEDLSWDGMAMLTFIWITYLFAYLIQLLF